MWVTKRHDPDDRDTFTRGSGNQKAAVGKPLD